MPRELKICLAQIEVIPGNPAVDRRWHVFGIEELNENSCHI